MKLVKTVSLSFVLSLAIILAGCSFFSDGSGINKNNWQ